MKVEYTIYLKVSLLKKKFAQKIYSRKQRICIYKYAIVNIFAHAKTSLFNTKHLSQNDK